MTNEELLYNAIKNWYISEYGRKTYFYKDYMESELGFQSFIEDVKRLEPWLDLTKEPSDEDIERLIESIKTGQEASGRIMIMVDRLTDKYIGDE